MFVSHLVEFVFIVVGGELQHKELSKQATDDERGRRLCRELCSVWQFLINLSNQKTFGKRFVLVSRAISPRRQLKSRVCRIPVELSISRLRVFAMCVDVYLRAIKIASKRMFMFTMRSDTRSRWRYFVTVEMKGSWADNWHAASRSLLPREHKQRAKRFCCRLPWEISRLAASEWIPGRAKIAFSLI